MKPVLLIGFGSIGQRYARLLGRNGLSFGVCDSDPSRQGPAKEAGALEFVPSLGDLKRYTAALVFSPNHLHLDHALTAAGQGLHLFIEKPLAISLDGLAGLRELVASRGLVAMVSCAFRFETGMKALAMLLSSGELGPVRSVLAEFGQYLPDWRPGTDYRNAYSAHRDQGGGVLLDRIHELDYLIHLLGTPRSVIARGGHLSTLEIDTEDVVDLLFEFEGGAISNLHLDYLQPRYVCRCKVIAERGTAFWQFNPSRLSVCEARSGQERVMYENSSPDIDQMYEDQLLYFVRCVESGGTPWNGLAEAEETLDWALRARRQLQPRS